MYHVYINKFPQGIEKFFVNLEALAIEDTDIKEVTQEDLKPFTKLKQLHLNSNKIKYIAPNLFEFQPNLELLALKNNLIEHIDPFVFNNLNSLKYLYLADNNCDNDKINVNIINDREKVFNLIKKIQQKKCVADFYPIYKTVSIEKSNLSKSLTTTRNELESEKIKNAQQNKTIFGLIGDLVALRNLHNETVDKFNKCIADF